MVTRKPRIALLIVCVLLLALAWPAQAIGLAPDTRPPKPVTPGPRPTTPAAPTVTLAPDDPGYPPPSPWPGLRVAEPRAGIAGMTQANADNLMIAPWVDPNEPVGTVRPGQRFWIRSDYEAVIFPEAAGEARFELEVYELTGENTNDQASLQDGDGGRELIGSDQAVVVGTGPTRRGGSLHVFGALTEPGGHRLEIISRTSARGLGGRFVVDEDSLIIWVFVASPATPTPSVTVEPAAESMAVVMTTPTPTEPDIVPTDRRLQVASPRGHFLYPQLAAVENFDQNHGRHLVVREGDSVVFSSAYEFVWFGGAGGAGETELTIRLESAREEDAPLGEDKAAFPGGANGFRVAGRLEAVVPFEEAGHYHVLAIIRSAVQPGGSTMLTAAPQEDVDTVRVEVDVIGEPEVGAIHGIVTAEENEIPLEGVVMHVLQADNGHLVSTVRTGPDGSYTAAGLRPGSYLIYADPQEQNYLPEWYDDAPTRREADPVAVRAGETTEGIDFELTAGGIISGWVYEDTPNETSQEPAPIPNVLILVGPYLNTQEGSPADVERGAIAKTRTQEDGSYRVEKLPAGRYWVYAGNESLSLIGEYYDDALERRDADPVEVVAGQETANINFRLRYGGAIAGRVVGVFVEPTDRVDEGEPGEATASLPEIYPFKVTAYDWVTGKAIRTVGVGPLGRYVLPSLPEGGYRVYAFDEANRFIPEYYDNVTAPEEATRVAVQRGTTTLGIDFELAMAGIATVEVRPAVTQVRPGDTFEIAIWVRDAMDLGGFAFELAYEPGVIELVQNSFQMGDFLGSTGRTVFELGPEFHDGWVRFGAGSYGDPPGPNGAGLLAKMTFQALTQGTSALDLRNVSLTDTAGQPIRSRTADGQAEVGDCIFGDFNCDCVVDIEDIMAVASRWGAVEGDPNYDPLYDVDNDGDIDIVDVMLVAAAWGNTCDGTTESSSLSGGVMLRSELLSTGLRLEPSHAAAKVGEPTVLQVWVDEAHDLGAFQFTLTYNAAQLAIAPKDVSLGAFLGSTGRSPYAVGPTIEVAGDAATLSYGAWTLGPTPPGPNGSGLLAEITVTPLRGGEALIAFTGAQVTDTTGQTQRQLATQGATLDVATKVRDFVPFVLR